MTLKHKKMVQSSKCIQKVPRICMYVSGAHVRAARTHACSREQPVPPIHSVIFALRQSGKGRQRGGKLVGHLLLLINETELLPWVLLYKGWRWWKGLEEQYACQKWRLMVVPAFQKCRAGCTRQWRILELAANLALLLLTWHFQAHQAEYTKEKAKKNISSDNSTPKTLHKMGSPFHVRLIHHLFLRQLKKKIISKKNCMCI